MCLRVGGADRVVGCSAGASRPAALDAAFDAGRADASERRRVGVAVAGSPGPADVLEAPGGGGRGVGRAAPARAAELAALKAQRIKVRAWPHTGSAELYFYQIEFE